MAHRGPGREPARRKKVRIAQHDRRVTVFRWALTIGMIACAIALAIILLNG